MDMNPKCESKSIECPCCGKMLEFLPSMETITCAWCGTKFTLRRKSQPPAVQTATLRFSCPTCQVIMTCPPENAGRQANFRRRCGQGLATSHRPARGRAHGK